MFYRNALKGLRGSDRVYSVKSFGGGMNTVSEDFLLEQGVAKISYNLSGKTGALRECGGFSAFTLPFDGKETEVTIGNKAITKVWYYRRFDLPTRKNDDRILLLSEDKRLYNIYVNGLDLGVSLVDERQFEETPEALNYRLNGEDVMIFCSGKDKMRVYNGVDTPTVIDDAPALSSICVHGERLFATSPDTLNTLWFSDDLDPTNWNISLDEAGFVEMADENGALLKVLSFFNYVYVFRSYGITRFYATGEQSRFSLMHLFVSSDRIIGDTVCVCGARILFLTQRGLFDFDGSGTVKILDRLSGLFEGEDNSQARAAYFGGKSRLPLEFQRRTQSDVRKGRLRKQRACGGGFGKRQRCRGARRGRRFACGSQRARQKFFACLFPQRKESGDFRRRRKRFRRGDAQALGLSQDGFGRSGQKKASALRAYRNGARFDAVRGGRRTGTHKICQRLRQAAKGALQRDGQRFQAVS